MVNGLRQPFILMKCTLWQAEHALLAARQMHLGLSKTQSYGEACMLISKFSIQHK